MSVCPWCEVPYSTSVAPGPEIVRPSIRPWLPRYIRDLEKLEREERERAKEEEKRNERRNRDAFKELLRHHW